MLACLFRKLAVFCCQAPGLTESEHRARRGPQVDELSDVVSSLITDAGGRAGHSSQEGQMLERQPLLQTRGREIQTEAARAQSFLSSTTTKLSLSSLS